MVTIKDHHTECIEWIWLPLKYASLQYWKSSAKGTLNRWVIIRKFELLCDVNWICKIHLKASKLSNNIPV